MFRKKNAYSMFDGTKVILVIHRKTFATLIHQMSNSSLDFDFHNRFFPG